MTDSGASSIQLDGLSGSDADSDYASETNTTLSNNVASLRLVQALQGHSRGGGAPGTTTPLAFLSPQRGPLPLLQPPGQPQPSALTQQDNRDSDLLNIVNSLNSNQEHSVPLLNFGISTNTPTKQEGTSHPNPSTQPLLHHPQFSTPQQIPESVFTSENRDRLAQAYDARQKYKNFVAPKSE